MENNEILQYCRITNRFVGGMQISIIETQTSRTDVGRKTNLSYKK